MEVPFGGGCACGAIRYECAAAPIYMGNCHCTRLPAGDRRRLHVGGGGEGERLFALLSGEPSWFERPSDGGHTDAAGLLPGMRLAACS